MSGESIPQCQTLLTNFGGVASIEKGEITSETTLMDDCKRMLDDKIQAALRWKHAFLVPLLVKRRAEDDVFLHRIRLLEGDNIDTIHTLIVSFCTQDSCAA